MKHRVSLPAGVPAAFSAVVLSSTSGNVHATPAFSLATEGACPSRVELVAALGSKGYAIANTAGGGNYRIFTRSEPGFAWLHLTGSAGERLLDRRFASSDCRALADAMAVVIETYFVEVGELQREQVAASAATAADAAEALPPPVAATAAMPSAGAAPQVPATNEPVDQGRRAGRPTTSPPTKKAALLPIPVVTNFKLRIPIQSDPKPARTVLGRAFIGIGPMVTMGQFGVLPKFELGGGVDVPKLPLMIDLALATSLATTYGSRPDRVWRWANQGLLRVGTPWGSGLRYRPWAGLGLSLAWIQGLDLATQPRRVSAAPLVGGGFETTWPIARDWSGRLDIGCLLVAIQEVYQVESDGEIGRGPRVVCHASLGIAVRHEP